MCNDLIDQLVTESAKVRTMKLWLTEESAERESQQVIG